MTTLREVNRRASVAVWIMMINLAIAALALGLVICAMSARADEPHHSNPWLLSWIPATCCVTNDCCWEVSERELTPLPDDLWRINSTGQVVPRKDWSPDGRFYRCACDFDDESKKWIRHQGAKTRCIFVPMRSSQASFPKRSE